MTSVAYLGPSGTNTEAAALCYLKLILPNLEIEQHGALLRAYPTIPQSIKAAATGAANVAVVPVENSIQGSVTMTLDALWEMDRLQIQQALLLPIHNALITQARDLRLVKAVYSHPQALAQCQQWLEKHLPQAQVIPAHSTTEGLQLVATDPTLAAIASERAADLNNLPVLACPINDHPDNCTRFWVLGLTDPTTKGTHTSLAFSVKQNLPGALVQPLSVFANRDINLSRIESRPTKRSLGDYIFFIDIEASVEQIEVREAIAALESFTETLKIFGSYAIASCP